MLKKFLKNAAIGLFTIDRLLHLAKEYGVVTLTIEDRDELYPIVKSEINSNAPAIRLRTSYQLGAKSVKSSMQTGLLKLRVRETPLLVWVDQETTIKDQLVFRENVTHLFQPPIHLKCLYPQRHLLNDWLESVRSAYYSSTRIPTLSCYNLRSSGDNFILGSINAPPLEAHNLSPDQSSIFLDLTSFIDSEDDYLARGQSYKRTYLLSGLPGTGKTTYVQQLAKHFKKDLLILSADDFFGNTLNVLPLMSANTNRWVLVDDIHRFFKRDTEDVKDSNKLFRTTGSMYSLRLGWHPVISGYVSFFHD